MSNSSTPDHLSDNVRIGARNKEIALRQAEADRAKAVERGLLLTSEEIQERKDEINFKPVMMRKAIPVGAFVPVNPIALKKKENDQIQSLIASGALNVPVRHLKIASEMTEADRPARKSSKKMEKEGRAAPVVLLPYQAVRRQVGECYTIPATEHAKSCFSLPEEQQQGTEEIALAFSKGSASSQIHLSLEGVRIQSLSQKNPKRQAEVSQITWILISSGQLYPLPRDWPLHTHVKEHNALQRCQANYAGKLLQKGIIDQAFLLLPPTNSDLLNGKLGQQFLHTAYTKRTAHVNSIGKVLMTSEVVGHASKESKPDSIKFTVTYQMRTGVINEKEEFVLRDISVPFSTEAQAIRCAKEALSLQGGSELVAKADRRLIKKDGVLQEVEIASEWQELPIVDKATIHGKIDPNKYPLTGNGSEAGVPVKAWIIDEQNGTATLSRNGLMALEADPKRDLWSRKANQVTKKKATPFGTDLSWRGKAKNDHCSFSRG